MLVKSLTWREKNIEILEPNALKNMADDSGSMSWPQNMVQACFFFVFWTLKILERYSLKCRMTESIHSVTERHWDDYTNGITPNPHTPHTHPNHNTCQPKLHFYRPPPVIFIFIFTCIWVSPSMRMQAVIFEFLSESINTQSGQIQWYIYLTDIV